MMSFPSEIIAEDLIKQIRHAKKISIGWCQTDVEIYKKKKTIFAW